MEDRYMNGVGIVQRTEELTDAMWNALGLALAGSYIMVAGLVVSAILIIEPDVSKLWLIPSSGLAITGVAFTVPWLRATRTLKKHTAAVKAMTAKYGNGWARS